MSGQVVFWGEVLNAKRTIDSLPLSGDRVF